jgi:hypothetical protein
VKTFGEGALLVLVEEVSTMKRGDEMRIRNVAASFGITALLLSFSAPAWSQADEHYVLSSNISDRFEGGEFGEPLGEVPRQSAMEAALASEPQPQYVYYVVPCDAPGAIRAGSPSALDPGTLVSDDTSPSGEAVRAEGVCVALVDENQTDSAPLLYTYDSTYRYPNGYPNHHRSSYYSGTYGSSINVGYSSSRRYGAFRYGAGYYGRHPYGLRHYGGYPYGIGHYGGYPYGGYPYGPFPYGAYSYGSYPHVSPYVSHHYSFGFSVGHYGRRHHGARHYAGRHYGRYGSSRYNDMHRSRLRY